MDAIDREIRVGRRFWFPPGEIHRPIVIRHDAHPLGTPGCDARSSRSNATRDRWTRSIDSMDAIDRRDRSTRSIDGIQRCADAHRVGTIPHAARTATREVLHVTHGPRAHHRALRSTLRVVTFPVSRAAIRRPRSRSIRQAHPRADSWTFDWVPISTDHDDAPRELNASPPRESNDANV